MATGDGKEARISVDALPSMPGVARQDSQNDRRTVRHRRTLCKTTGPNRTDSKMKKEGSPHKELNAQGVLESLRSTYNA